MQLERSRANGSSAEVSTAQTPRQPKKGLFATTRWSLVLAAKDLATPKGERALAWLCEAYWYPLYGYARYRGRLPEDAQDLVQGFFLMILAGKFFQSVQGGRGSFRAFMKVCFDNYCAGEHQKMQREKRGGALCGVPLTAEVEERFQRDFTDARTPELNFDRAWAVTVLERATARLREECEAEGKGGRFVVLRRFLQGERAGISEAEAATQLDMTLSAVKATIFRLRKRFREVVMHEVRHTVVSPDEVETELRHLIACFST